jgi:hypothetical protein
MWVKSQSIRDRLSIEFTAHSSENRSPTSAVILGLAICARVPIPESLTVVVKHGSHGSPAHIFSNFNEQ